MWRFLKKIFFALHLFTIIFFGLVLFSETSFCQMPPYPEPPPRYPTPPYVRPLDLQPSAEVLARADACRTTIASDLLRSIRAKEDKALQEPGSDSDFWRVEFSDIFPLFSTVYRSEMERWTKARYHSERMKETVFVIAEFMGSEGAKKLLRRLVKREAIEPRHHYPNSFWESRRDHLIYEIRSFFFSVTESDEAIADFGGITFIQAIEWSREGVEGAPTLEARRVYLRTKLTELIDDVKRRHSIRDLD